MKCSVCGEYVSVFVVEIGAKEHVCEKCCKEKIQKEKLDAGWLFDAYTWQTPEVSAAQYVNGGPLLGAALNRGMASFQPAGFYCKGNQILIKFDGPGSEMRVLNQIILGPGAAPSSSRAAVNEITKIDIGTFTSRKRFTKREWQILWGFTTLFGLVLGVIAYSQTKHLDSAIVITLAFPLLLIFYGFLGSKIFTPTDAAKDAKSKGLILIKFLLSSDRVFSFAVKKSELDEINVRLAKFNLKIPPPAKS